MMDVVQIIEGVCLTQADPASRAQLRAALQLGARLALEAVLAEEKYNQTIKEAAEALTKEMQRNGDVVRDIPTPMMQTALNIARAEVAEQSQLRKIAEASALGLIEDKTRPAMSMPSDNRRDYGERGL